MALIFARQGARLREILHQVCLRRSAFEKFTRPLWGDYRQLRGAHTGLGSPGRLPATRVLELHSGDRCRSLRHSPHDSSVWQGRFELIDVAGHGAIENELSQSGQAFQYFDVLDRRVREIEFLQTGQTL